MRPFKGKYPGNAQVIPVESAIHGTYTGGNQELALKQSFLRTPQSTLTMNGVVSQRSSLDLKFQSNNLSELETVADVFRTPLQGSPQPLGLAGTALFQGTVRGSTSDPHLTGQLTASNFRFNGTAWRVLRTNVDVSPSMASLQHADLEPASHGKITFNASAGLHKWAFTDASPLQVDLDASQIGRSGPGEAFRAASAGDGYAGGEHKSAWHRIKSHRARERLGHPYHCLRSAGHVGDVDLRRHWR